MVKWIEASELPIGEKVYLKKDFLGWRVIEPWKDLETGKINWFNFLLGGKRNLAILLLLLVLIGFSYMAYEEQITNFKQVVNNPCAFCKDCQQQVKQMLGGLEQETEIVLPKLNITG